jgi:hypothetical protein
MPRSSTEADERPGAGPAGAEDDTVVPSRSALRALRQFLNAHREGWALEPRMATAARMAAEDAHRLGLTPERMLVALKRAWASLDEVRRLPMLDAGELLSRLVTLSIRAYYEPGRRPGPPTGSHGGAGARGAA